MDNSTLARPAVPTGAGPAPASPGPTAEMAAWLSAFRPADLTPAARAWARACLLDWSAVTVAGSAEPLSAMLRDELAPEAASPPSGVRIVAANGRRAAPTDAALINGAMSHALDFDDVHRRMHGHPTVVIAPAVLALAEDLGASGDQLIAAFVAGLEIAGALGAMMDDAHYEHGFHATATVGTVAAAAGCAQLMGLDPERAAWALSLAGAQAAGLKASFGTMAKPLHAGRAASNGLLSARLAARGFTARPDGLECEQGFGPTLSTAFAPAPFRPDPAAPFEVEEVLFKYHAACYLTHSAIESLKTLRAESGIGAEDLERLVLHVPVPHTRVCDIREPRSGLDVKFSIRSLAGLTLMGADTAALDLYTDATARDPKVAELRGRVEVDPRPVGTSPRHGAAITLTTKDGRTFRAEANVGVPATDLAAQQGRLEAKARAIATPVIGEARAEAMIAAAASLDGAPDLSALLDAIR